MEIFAVFATIFALIAVGSASGEHVRKVIHIPYKIHTVHHHKVQKVPVPVPVVKKVPVYKTVEVPIVQKVFVPIVQKVHVPVHVPIHDHSSMHQESHQKDSNAFQHSYNIGNNHQDLTNAWQWQQQVEGSQYSGGYW